MPIFRSNKATQGPSSPLQAILLDSQQVNSILVLLKARMKPVKMVEVRCATTGGRKWRCCCAGSRWCLLQANTIQQSTYTHTNHITDSFPPSSYWSGHCLIYSYETKYPKNKTTNLSPHLNHKSLDLKMMMKQLSIAQFNLPPPNPPTSWLIMIWS